LTLSSLYAEDPKEQYMLLEHASRHKSGQSKFSPGGEIKRGVPFIKSNQQKHIPLILHSMTVLPHSGPFGIVYFLGTKVPGKDEGKFLPPD
jgi:hypothetical protein